MTNETQSPLFQEGDPREGAELGLGPLAAVGRRLPEMIEIMGLAHQLSPFGDVRVEGEITGHGIRFPVHSFAFGAERGTAPVLALIGGVHGLERIGTLILISFLKTLLELLPWDRAIQHLLSRCRLVILPLVNPAGMYARTRANANGVDLMRNAPLDAETEPNLVLLGGHRVSPRLPWFRGHEGQPPEAEAVILADWIRRELFPAPFATALDLHSGFGLVDRLWFPFAYTHRPFDHLDVMFTLKHRLDRGLPNHVYYMEPQSRHYLTHGDLWDWLFLEHKKQHSEALFLPLTLEMGSWIWIKKNPRQLFSPLGIFNPVLPHRLQRTQRRHLALIDFLLRAAASFDNWSHQGRTMRVAAERFWYGKTA